MNIYINKQDATPFYDQIYIQLRDYIIDGILGEDDLLPSIRSLTTQLRVSMITVKRAYEELERDNYIYSVPGKGSYVQKLDHKKIKEIFTQEAQEAAEKLVTASQRASMSFEEILAILNQTFTNHQSKSDKD